MGFTPKRSAPTYPNLPHQRNRSRFPEDFIFQLSAKEKIEVVTNCDHLTKLKFSPTLPYAFTEHGAVMVASILNTKRAVEVSIYVVRAFVKFRGLLASHRALAGKLAELEQRVKAHDETLQALVEAIKKLMMPPEKPKRKIGFIAKERRAVYKTS